MAMALPLYAHLEIRLWKGLAVRVDIPAALPGSPRHSAHHSAGSSRAFPSSTVQLTSCLTSRAPGEEGDVQAVFENIMDVIFAPASGATT
jgi:hypothetical protein